MFRIMAHARVVKWSAPFERQQAEDDEWDAVMGNVDLDELDSSQPRC